ncbi:hypothetical protein BpHYR1_049436 [Brachionus plicatilis]|uniref:RNA-directed DNA polymerase from mobile element jockey-like n=1 Tax=Brachionus plicatilis TaxID=10195 RepID=A0A3M7R3G7_BRAPC|nr:hypothetical protein BpHYR1_049436 [Brachionus plicatilis]
MSHLNTIGVDCLVHSLACVNKQSLDQKSKNFKIVVSCFAAVNRITEHCKKWEFKINEKKTCYTTFTKAGLRKNYEKRYGMKIKIGNSHIPLDPNPTFLGIKLDPKGSSFKINRILYMSLIRSLFDYCFIILQSGTQKKRAEMQKMQNRILQSHEIIVHEIQDFLLQNSCRNNLNFNLYCNLLTQVSSIELRYYFLDFSSTLPQLFLDFSFPFLRVEERNSRRRVEEKSRNSRKILI